MYLDLQESITPADVAAAGESPRVGPKKSNVRKTVKARSSGAVVSPIVPDKRCSREPILGSRVRLDRGRLDVAPPRPYRNHLKVCVSIEQARVEPIASTAIG